MSITGRYSISDLDFAMQNGLGCVEMNTDNYKYGIVSVSVTSMSTPFS